MKDTVETGAASSPSGTPTTILFGLTPRADPRAPRSVVVLACAKATLREVVMVTLARGWEKSEEGRRERKRRGA